MLLLINNMLKIILKRIICKCIFIGKIIVDNNILKCGLQFVAHPFIQQLLATVWYEGLPGFRRLQLYKQIIEIIKIVYFFPFYCLVYLYAPSYHIGKVMEKPFMKFLIHSSSYLSYLGEYQSILCISVYC